MTDFTHHFRQSAPMSNELHPPVRRYDEINQQMKRCQEYSYDVTWLLQKIVTLEAQVKVLQGDLERASNPIEHADAFTPIIEGLKAERDALQARLAEVERERGELAKLVQQTSKPCGAPDCEPYKQAEAALTEARAALQNVVDGEYDDLEPDDGLHKHSVRAMARAFLDRGTIKHTKGDPP